jgi:hypothetical protein
MKNQTGRLFKCIGLNEDLLNNCWNDHFDIDEVYPEVIDKYNITEDNNCVLMIKSNSNRTFCVDANQFELLEE